MLTARLGVAAVDSLLDQLEGALAATGRIFLKSCSVKTLGDTFLALLPETGKRRRGIQKLHRQCIMTGGFLKFLAGHALFGLGDFAFSLKLERLEAQLLSLTQSIAQFRVRSLLVITVIFLGGLKLTVVSCDLGGLFGLSLGDSRSRFGSRRRFLDFNGRLCRHRLGRSRSRIIQ